MLNKNINKDKKKSESKGIHKGLAISQIIILMLGIVSFSYILGSEIGFVSGLPSREGYELDSTGFSKYLSSVINLPVNLPKLNLIKGKSEGDSTNEQDAKEPEKPEEKSEGDSEPFLGEPRFREPLEEALGKSWGAFTSYLVRGVTWAGAVYGGIELFKEPLEGLIGPDWTDALQRSLTAGTFISQVSKGIAESGALWSSSHWLVGPIAAGIYFVLSYAKTDYKSVTFECNPWQPSTDSGDQRCDNCGEGGLPCSEYQCRSLGQSCKLLNDENTGNAVCVQIDSGDINPPVMQAWEDALPSGYSYNPLDVKFPEDRGVKIETEEGNPIPPFTQLSLGISTYNTKGDPKPSRCKIDVVRKDSFEDMAFFMSNGIYKYNHSYELSVPSPDSAESENITLKHGTEQEIYIRCEDGNENRNVGTFVFKFDIDEGEDTTPPMIDGTNLPSGTPLASGVSNAEVSIYINEPVKGCKWDYEDKIYGSMNENMDCSQGNEFSDMNSQGVFTCVANLTGIKSEIENNFYFRCEDKNENVMRESYDFSLEGTRPLVITSITPNNSIIKDSTTPIKVGIETETDSGADNGVSTCYYKESSEPFSSYIQFLETGSYTHKQNLWLPEGEHNYDVRCVDKGGNAGSSSISFTLESDTDAPTVIRAYKEESYLKIVSNEESECVYDTFDCDYAFSDGIGLTTTEGKIHYTDWTTDSAFYVKCKDKFSNRPNSNECSIIIRPLED